MAALEAAGVQIHTWSPEILAELEAAWNKVAARMASDDPEFARVWESLQAFRKKYKAWSDRGYLKE